MFEGIKKIFETSPKEEASEEKVEIKEKTKEPKVARDTKEIIKEEKEKKGEDWWREQL